MWCDGVMWCGVVWCDGVVLSLCFVRMSSCASHIIPFSISLFLCLSLSVSPFNLPLCLSLTPSPFLPLSHPLSTSPPLHLSIYLMFTSSVDFEKKSWEDHPDTVLKDGQGQPPSLEASKTPSVHTSRLHLVPSSSSSSTSDGGRLEWEDKLVRMKEGSNKNINVTSQPETKKDIAVAFSNETKSGRERREAVKEKRRAALEARKKKIATLRSKTSSSTNKTTHSSS